jgi:hypothetical protein
VADIIRLDDHRNRATRTSPTNGGPAQLLLFTGVRYERLEKPVRRRGPGIKGTKAKAKRG